MGFDVEKLDRLFEQASIDGITAYALYCMSFHKLEKIEQMVEVP